ncbi:MAG: aminotransferase class III-fold pyridoxal phosphate-dependent enzyme, partial [Leucobacter sp.]|nr:aminotransferase class III-fold pyridoxal phosphate-dependent enzyme [Leucobacter sp.]
RHPSVGEYRGVGLFWALELVTDRETRSPLEGEGFNAVVAACKKAGLWPFAAGNRLQLAPPLVISESDLFTGLNIIDEVLSVADSYYTG